MKWKTMVILAAVLAAVASFSLAGCSSGETMTETESITTEETAAPEEEASASVLDEDDQAVVGHWQMTKNTIGGEELDISDIQTVYIFNEDGSFEMLLNGDSVGQGIFTAEGTAITFDIGSGENEMRLEDGRLIAETETDDGVAVTVYERAQN